MTVNSPNVIEIKLDRLIDDMRLLRSQMIAFDRQVEIGGIRRRRGHHPAHRNDCRERQRRDELAASSLQADTAQRG